MPDESSEIERATSVRGRTRYLTHEDLAEAMGIKIESSQNRGFPRSVTELVARVAGRWRRTSRQLSQVERAAWLRENGVGTPDDWANRYPRLKLYRCGVPRCNAVVLGAPGTCWDHGTAPLWTFSDAGLFQLRIGAGFEPLHHVMINAPRDALVIYRDGNPWNNRPANLERVTSKNLPKPPTARKNSETGVTICCDHRPPAIGWDDNESAVRCNACGKRWAPVGGATLNLADLEIGAIRRALNVAPSRTAAADMLGVTRHTLKRKMIKHGLIAS